MVWVGDAEPTTQVWNKGENMNKNTEPSLLPSLQNEKTGSSVQEGRQRRKYSLEVNKVAGEVSMTWGLSKAHLQEWKGLKLQVETKRTLNT